MTITVSTPEYHSAIGGIMALHKLAKKLHERGHDVYVHIWSGTANPFNLPTTKEAKGVVIYPEIALNPLNASKCVRWCLNEPGRLGGTKEHPGELVFYFWPYFAPHGSENILTVLEVQDVWHDIGKKRSGCCHTVRKGQPFDVPMGSVDIGTTGDYSRLAELFNEREFFVTSDDRTFLSQQAALCGCTSVVIPGERTRDEWISLMPINKYGVAYGWDDVPHAVETRPLLRGLLNELQAGTEIQIDNLITKIQEIWP